jgi:N6-L-threonylcarbamoyladenine synthase/protein kinase Bud32
MICLSLEGTAHTFGAAIVSSKGTVLSDVRDMYKTVSGGIIPSEAAKHHENVKDEIIRKAIEASKEKHIDFVAYSRGPGLSPCLRVALKAAKELSEKLKVPLIGVNHAVAHLTSGLLFTNAKDPVYIYVSGANTQIIVLENKKYRILGETMDTGLGNALDKFGRGINLGFPAGPLIENIAKTGKYYKLPYTVKGMDLTFSGITTKAINDFKNKNISKEDLCFSMQETLFSMLTEVSERALAHTRKNELLLIGGVAANKRLVEMLSIMCKERDARFFSVPLEYSGDQAVMIAWQGLLEFNKVKKPLDIYPYERIDQIDVEW